MRKFIKAASVIVTSVMVLSACNSANFSKEKQTAKANTTSQVIEPHKNLNQKPTPLNIERVGEHEVNIEMTAQITDIEITKDNMYKAWTFNGEAPGPVIVVNEGDTINFTLKNMDPSIPLSMDFHAVHASPSQDFIDIMPNETGSFTYPANNPGVFMYHCGTKPVLAISPTECTVLLLLSQKADIRLMLKSIVNLSSFKMNGISTTTLRTLQMECLVMSSFQQSFKRRRFKY
ncbi:hypothetical protein QFZ31_004995 [Neobacillus niacini]|nr:hypothetical protein [Neobacillus niacini]